ncbi:carboxypeptidase-like regulatory domain-containing protein [Pontibacter sp. BT731]|uniref:carboxypeptidase-like regulatory domain-containing protein n=1 Tax=Pontibacter coccineus TaxID=3063328 RepID=UPI0026E15B21|nr:carboxypeptidase-like regulatory domain-containing protein [Pontibacter sp. BT731]MDO6391212.1 carboxypeptidase-like regulatory domain-containing protein [Pontibacter sp. BT731]
MQPDKPHILWERGDHPSVELLEQYHEGTLPPALHHQLERHLLDCDLCSDVLEGLAVSEAAQTESHVQEINRRIAAKSRRQKRKPVPLYLTDWRVAAAVAMVLLSTIVVFYYNYQQVREKQGIAQQERAIQEAMDLSEKPSPAIPETIADAAPDTVRPNQIAAVTKPVPLHRPRTRKAPVSADEGFVFPDYPAAPNNELEEQVNHTNTESIVTTIPEKPPVTEQAGKLAEVTVPAAPQRNTFQPESTSVAKALHSRVAGVQVQRSKQLGPNQVQGKVVDQDGTPLPGVSVVVKGTTHGVATDTQGNFVLTLPDEKATLAFRFIGYQTREKGVDVNSGPIVMDMEVDNRSLSEVVVTRQYTPNPAPVVAAKPAAGHKAYRQYLADNLRYTPEMPKGRVVIRATVSTSGAVENLEVVRGLCGPCDDEAMRLVAQGPKWQPATQDGHKVEQQVRIVVRFRPEKAN